MKSKELLPTHCLHSQYLTHLCSQLLPPLHQFFHESLRRHHNSKQQQIRCMSHQGFILKHQCQRTTFFRELEHHKECLTFQKSIPKVKPTKYIGDPLLWLDWIGLFNATIHSSDMTTAEKMTHLQSLVKDQSEISHSRIRTQWRHVLHSNQTTSRHFWKSNQNCHLFYNALIDIRFQLLNNLILSQCTSKF